MHVSRKAAIDAIFDCLTQEFLKPLGVTVLIGFFFRNVFSTIFVSVKRQRTMLPEQLNGASGDGSEHRTFVKLHLFFNLNLFFYSSLENSSLEKSSSRETRRSFLFEPSSSNGTRIFRGKIVGRFPPIKAALLRNPKAFPPVGSVLQMLPKSS